MDSAILDAFFEECEDLLTALVDGLDSMRSGDTDPETVNAVFRAVHSIKGAAGAFSMEALVTFAHTFETVLDKLRAGSIAADDELLKVLQRAGDVLSELVEVERDGGSSDKIRIDGTVSALETFLGGSEVAEELSFEALSLNFDDPSADQTYSVRFRPTLAFYSSGHDPFNLIQALGELGPVRTCCNRSDLPADIDGFHPEEGYLSWHIEVDNQGSDLGIREVFEFVDDLCDLEVNAVTSQNADEPDNPTGPLETIEPAFQPAASTELPAPVPTKEPPAKKMKGSLRVDPERVDRLINAVGELIINQSVISQRIQEAALPSSSELHSDLDDYKLLAREIQEGVMAIRAQPVKPLFQRMLRIAREAADATGKSVNIETIGEATEVDKSVVERLADPLTHMIRNAIDHGIEAPENRKASGKPQIGSLRLSASQKSGTIVLEISDDGAGLNRERIRDIAIKKKLIGSDQQLSDQQIDNLLFAPGFSTATEVTNLSGRGVGMDVVKTAITELGGRISISSTPGAGTVFSISLPLTLAVMDGMVVNVSGQTFVVPISSIAETVRPSTSDLSPIGLEGMLLRIRGEYIPIVDLGGRLGNAQPQTDLTEKVLLIVQNDSAPQCALAVDDIYDQRQVVVKSMHGPLGDISGVSGATILGDGKIALIIDIDAIATSDVPSPVEVQISKRELERA